MARDRRDVRAVRSRAADNATVTPITVTHWNNMPEGVEPGVDEVRIYEMHDRSIVGVHGIGTQLRHPLYEPYHLS